MKNILIFSDLEGTLLREQDGKYDEQEMFKLLEQIARLEEIEDAEARVHIISPVFVSQMDNLLKEFDETVRAYNKTASHFVNYIEGATAYQTDEDFFSRRVPSSRIVPLNYNYDIMNPGLYGTEKLNYVTGCIQSYIKRGPVECIYMGNGRNDIKAMKYVKEKGGYVICPSNSRHDVKAIAHYVSSKEDLEGLIDGFSRLCDEREASKQRRTPTNGNNKDQADDEDYDY